MTTLATTESPAVDDVEVNDTHLTVSLADGRRITVPLTWYRRLLEARPDHRQIWRLVGKGHGIHFPELDEDISVENLLRGQRSGESLVSFTRWKECYSQKITRASA